MNKLDSLLMRRMVELDLRMDLLIRYIDDVIISIWRILSGYQVVDGELVFNERLKEEDEAADDDGESATSRVLVQVMNNLLME